MKEERREGRGGREVREGWGGRERERGGKEGMERGGWETKCCESNSNRRVTHP